MADNFNWNDFQAEETPANKAGSFNWEDFDADQEAPEVSKLESLGRGISQGLSFDTMDELTGATEAGAKALVGQDSYKDLLQNYKKYRDESRADYKAAEEANPSTYMSGDVGAGIATGLLTGGAGAVANLGKVGLKQGAKELAKQGLKQGAAYGLGSSEAELLDGDLLRLEDSSLGIPMPKGAIGDTLVGAGVGATVGAVLPSVVKGAGKAVGALGETIADKAPALTEKATQAFDLAQRGINTVGKKAREAVGTDASDIANKLIKDFRTQYKEGSDKVGTALKSRDSDIDFSTSLKELEDTLKVSGMLPDDLAKIQRELDLYKEITNTETVDPGLKKAIEKMEKLIEQQKGEASVLGQNVNFVPQEPTEGGRFLQTLKTTAEPTGETSAKVMQVEVPEDQIIKETVENYKTLGLQELNDIKKQIASSIGNSSIDKKSKSILQRLKGEVDALIVNSMDPSNQALYKQGNEEISNVYNAGNLVKELSPESAFDKDLDISLAKKLTSSSRTGEVDRALGYGSNLADIDRQAVKDLPVRQQLQKDLQGESGFFGGLVNPKGLAIRAGEAAGTVSRKVQPIKDFTKTIVKSDDAMLGNIAQRLQTSGDQNLAKFGSTIEKALQDTTKRDRLLWSLSQQPAFRDYVNEITEEPQN